jgi:threonyl-tRNA synthetase
MERVVAALLERYAGRLPLWLAPVQLCVLPVSSAQDDAARRIADEARGAGLRVRVEHDGSLGARIRASRQRRDCVMAVLGPAEVGHGQVQAIDPGAGQDGVVALERLVPLLRDAYESRGDVDWPPA